MCSFYRHLNIDMHMHCILLISHAFLATGYVHMYEWQGLFLIYVNKMPMQVNHGKLLQ